MLPREHGSWAVLAAPIAVGLAAAGGGSPAVILAFLCAALGGFCMRTPLLALCSGTPSPGAGRWLAWYGALAAAGLAPLILRFERRGLLAFAAPVAVALVFNLRQNLNRRPLSLGNELIGIAALCLGAPASYYAARGGMAPEAWSAWLICLSYFFGPILHVKMAALQHRASADSSLIPALGRMRRATLLYHGTAVSLIAAGAFLAEWPWPAVLPFLAALDKTRRRAALGRGKVDFRRLGRQEVGHCLLFIIAMALGYR